MVRLVRLFCLLCLAGAGMAACRQSSTATDAAPTIELIAPLCSPPVGAGEEITGPGGDGFFTVVTPASPIGSAVMGRREGESVSTRIRGALREWTVVWVG